MTGRLWWVSSDILLVGIIIGQAVSSADASLVQTFLTAGVAGAVIIAAIAGLIFFKPERTQLLASIADLRATTERYIAIHHDTTLPTLSKAVTLFESVVTALNALTKAWDDQARSNAEVSRRLEAIERRLDRSPLR